MAWKLENLRKDPNSKESYADLFISQIKEEPKTACLFTIGDARAVEIILEKYKNTQFVVFDYPALIKFLDFAKPKNLFKAIPIKYDWESESEFLGFVEAEMQKTLKEIEGTNMSFDLIIANPPYSNSLYKQIINKIAPFCSQLSILCPWDLVTAANKGKATRDMLNNHVIDYTQMSAEIFGSPLQLICGSFNFTKETGKCLKPFDPHSIDAVIFKKFAAYKDQMRDHVYWSKGITGNNNNDPVKCEEFIKGSYNHQVFRSISALRYPKRLLTEPDEPLRLSMWGIPDETSYNLIKKAAASEDFQYTVQYITKVIGDARDIYQKEVSYIPLFTKFEELNLTAEEIERIRNI